MGLVDKLILSIRARKRNRREIQGTLPACFPLPPTTLNHHVEAQWLTDVVIISYTRGQFNLSNLGVRRSLRGGVLPFGTSQCLQQSLYAIRCQAK